MPWGDQLDDIHAFVRWAWEEYLGRQPTDPNTMGAWVTLANTSGREAVIAGLIASPEGQLYQAAKRKATGVGPAPA